MRKVIEVLKLAGLALAIGLIDLAIELIDFQVSLVRTVKSIL